MGKINSLLILLLLSLVSYSCATTKQLSRTQVLQQSSDIAKLEERVTNAQRAGVDYLAPIGFKEVWGYLNKAFFTAYKHNLVQANQLAREGLKLIGKVEHHAEQSRKIMEGVLTVRSRAERAGASTLFPVEAAKREKEFRQAAHLVERGKVDQAKDLRPKLISGFSSLELMSMKRSIAQEAGIAIARAKQKDADNFAPKTLRQAERELVLIYSVLDANRVDTSKANAHARRAIEQAHRSIYITELVKDFKRRGASLEDLVRWHQNDLTVIGEAIGPSLTFDEPNRNTVKRLTIAIAALTDAEQDIQLKMKELLNANQQELAKIRTKYDLERETQGHFETVQLLFRKDEATVYQQKQNVLLSVHGFYFPSGKSEIRARNYSLLKKISRAIAEFEGSRILISGHTDSRGSKKLNLKISRNRAAKVAEFLSTVEGIDKGRLRIEGYGAEKPIVSNDTAAGRARNRRVEILIINE